MVTMKDVAAAAGVSQASVSYAYSGSQRVSAVRREHIFAVAASLGYTGPNIAGSSLRLGRIGAVGVLIPGSLSLAVEDPSTMLLVRGIVEVGELADVALTLLPVDPQRGNGNDPVKNDQVKPAVLRGLVDGVVIHCLPDDHPVVEAVRARKIPAVAIDSPRVPHLPYVTVDHRQAGAGQMDHVLSMGHRRIGVITDRIGPLPSPGYRYWADAETSKETYLRERLAGYRQALSDHGVRVSDVALIEAANIDMPSGLAAAELLIREFAPTAIVATSDVHAVAALKALSSNGIAVPDAVSVIGFDDAPIADLVGLTTIRQPLRDKGRTAAKILLDLIAGQSRRRSIMATELIVRSTTGPAPRQG
jgi:DNA-binding LacI/PurR family transcriptional regulator